MLKVVEENIYTTLKLIENAKKQHKSVLKIKVYQTETKDGVTKLKYYRAGMLKDGDCESVLKGLGYKVSYVSTDTQATEKRDGNGVIKAVVVRPLRTTSMVIEF